MMILDFFFPAPIRDNSLKNICYFAFYLGDLMRSDYPCLCVSLCLNLKIFRVNDILKFKSHMVCWKHLLHQVTSNAGASYLLNLNWTGPFTVPARLDFPVLFYAEMFWWLQAPATRPGSSFCFSSNLPILTYFTLLPETSNPFRYS